MAILSANDLVEAANAVIAHLPADEAVKLIGDPSVLFVDLREPDEIAGTGLIAGAVPVPRGVLEWIADPTSARHLPAFGTAARIVLYCAAGGRSALAARSLQEMGLRDVAHVPGGFAALKAAGAAVAPLGETAS